MSFPRAEIDVPFVTAEQMREVDRLMVEEYGVHLIQMMENAGRNLAALARRRFLGGDARGRRVLVLAGTGGNGGGGLACARWLHNWGANVTAFLSAPASRFKDVPGLQLDVLQRMGVPTAERGSANELPQADLILDALIGYSLRNAPSGSAAGLIDTANRHDAPVLALDVPSGVDSTTGTTHDPAISAAACLTLALPKEGLRAPGARAHVGELYLGDIGVPPELYARPALGLDVGSIFAQNEIVRLW